MQGNCNLCNKYKELQKVCHVLPEFFYRDINLFHEYHNLVCLDLKTFLKNGEKKIISNKQKTGEFDKYMFCPDCDRKVIGSYESYGREFFFAESLPKGKELIFRDNNGYLEVFNANYSKLKLLFLSILWRASISDRPAFSEIQLPLNVREEIREMILLGNPKKDIEFPVYFMNSLFDKSISNDFFFQPVKMTVAEENGFIFALGGMIIIFTIGINGVPNSLLKIRIQENGIFRSLNIPHGRTWLLIKDWYSK